ncbi:MAG: hypothetical protein V1726_07455 [Methanobacteriota archaeon]
MGWNKKLLMIGGLAGGIFLFFVGMAVYIMMGPSTDTYLLPRQVSAVIKLTGMGILCITMIVGGLVVKSIDKDTKTMMLLFGVVLLLLNIFIISYVR